MWADELEEVARCRASLDWEAAAARARQQVVRWRAVDGVAANFYKPLPLVAKGAQRGTWLAGDAETNGTPRIVGLDEADRPVIAVRDRGSEREAVAAMWRYDDAGFDEIDQHTYLRATIEGGRVVRTASAEAHATYAGV